MADFTIRFFICNVFISGIIGILLTAKRIFKNSLSSRMQYNLWFLLLGLLAVPFIPFPLIGFPLIFSWLENLSASPVSIAGATIENAVGITPAVNPYWMNDYTLSVNSKAPAAGYLLLGIWILGMSAMILLVIKSALRMHTLEKSALPLQNPEVRRLYSRCMNEIGIKREIPIYSTAYLKSPVIVGLLKPCIYLPIHLVSDYNEPDMRYMLLHELQHYKHRDAIAGYLMNVAGVIYWFNPLVWYAIKEIRNDREVACDTSVLEMLHAGDYEDYGNTLINFAEKVSLSPFPFAASLGGNMKQMKKRIVNIATYKKPTFWKRLKGMAAFMITAGLLLALTPFISTYAADEDHYRWQSSSERISYVDFSSYFKEYEGSFVLYDSENESWSIHGREHATLRVAPNSTYKIYNALLGLEKGIIAPNNSFIPWNGNAYPFETWNADQNLESAMNSSVNWYFQTIDKQLGAAAISDFLKEIGYGNKNMSSDFSAYWMESSLKISPVEQVELLTKLHNNSFGFSPENINVVKDAICLFSSAAGSFYGKSGTGRVNGRNVNGWFIGFIEAKNNTYFFATNIGADYGAAGSNAADITMSILADMNIL